MNLLAQAFHQFLSTPLFGITLTVAVHAASVRLWHRCGRTPLLTPVLVSMLVIVALLTVTGVSYESYMLGGNYLAFLLGPATVALAVPLYRAFDQIRRFLVPITVGVVAGSTVAMATGVLTVRVLGGDHVLEATMAPKSATTPIAIAMAESAGGNASLTAVLTVLTGVLGAIAGPGLLDLLRIGDPRVRGLAMGVSSHGIGTGRALAAGPVTGAFAALAMALSGVVTSLLVPAVLALLG